MSRRYKDFLTAYLKYTEKTEPPTSYHAWTCLSVIAGALQRKVYLRWGFRNLFPNMYVVLIGPSGARKGTAMTIGKDLLNEIPGVRLCSESVTREALIRDMRESVTTFQDPTDGLTKFHCSITALAEELAVFLGQGNLKFLADLTDWFDCAASWTYRTKNSGVDKLTGICLNILGASAPDWLRSILPTEAYGGGFTSRIIFVVEDGKKHQVADPTLPPEVLAMRDGLIHDLEQISLLAGEFTFAPETMEFYREWYLKQGKSPAIKDPHFAGYCERRAVHALKLSIVCSASRGDDQLILPIDLKRSIAMLEAVEPKMPRTFMGLGKAKLSEITAVIFDYLRKVGQTSRSELLEKYHLDLDEASLNSVMKTLHMRKVIKLKVDTAKDEIFYYLNVKKEGETESVGSEKEQ